MVNLLGVLNGVYVVVISSDVGEMGMGWCVEFG